MALTSADLLRFLLEFMLLLVCARGLGEAARRLNQPQVIGELLGGVVLGPSLLGAVAPGLFAVVFPTQGPQPLLLQLLAQFGVILLLLVSGIEVDVDLVRRKVRPALLVAVGGVVVPFLCGYGLAALLPTILVAHVHARSVFDLLVATAMSISAIPVIVKILLDMDLMRRDVGQLTLAAGVINDAAGWFLLAMVSGIATARVLPLGSVAVSVFGTLAFAAFCFTLGYRLIRALVNWVDDHFGGGGATLTVVLAVGLGGAAVTQALHVEAFLGAFLVGVQLSRVPRVARSARPHLEAMTLGVFAPVFFAAAGLKVDLPALASPGLLAVLLAVIAVACLGKFAGTYLGARLAGVSPWLSAALGAGMNARGAVEIIVATAGLQLGVLTVPMYSIIVAMAVATSVLAPSLLRWTLQRAPADPDERQRLDREAREAQSFLHGLRRMLVPVRDGRYALVAGEVVAHLAAARAVEAVALHIRAPQEVGGVSSVPSPGRGADAAKVEWQQRVVPAGSGIAEGILAEAARGYDLLVLGSAAIRPGSGLFGDVVDSVVRATPCTTLVLQAARWRREGVRLRRILLPTVGTRGDLRVAEFALALARGTSAEVLALHLVDAGPLTEPLDSRALGALQAANEYGWHATMAVSRLGEGIGVTVRRDAHVLVRGTVGEEIVKCAAMGGADLILMHAERHAAGGELYCGRTVDQVLRSARCPVAVLLDPAQ